VLKFNKRNSIQQFQTKRPYFLEVKKTFFLNAGFSFDAKYFKTKIEVFPK